MFKKVLFAIIGIIAMSFILTGCNDSNKDIELEKGLSEVRFLENQCITIFNKYLSGDYLLEDSTIDWNSINEDFSVSKNSIDVILIDFASIQIPSKSIVELENNFRKLEEYLIAKDINNFIGMICDSYNLISYSILNNMAESEEIKLEKKAKTDLLYVGYFLMGENKDEAINNLNLFQTNYSNLSSNKEYIENNSYKINKIFYVFF